MKTCKVPGCPNELKNDTFGRRCEDHWALAQMFWGDAEPNDVPEFDHRSEKLAAMELVAA